MSYTHASLNYFKLPFKLVLKKHKTFKLEEIEKKLKVLVNKIGTWPYLPLFLILADEQHDAFFFLFLILAIIDIDWETCYSSKQISGILNVSSLLFLA